MLATVSGRLRMSTVATMEDSRLAQKFVDACLQTNLKTIKKMMSKKDVDVDALYRFESGMEKMTGLHFAAQKGKMPMLKVLLEGGCKVNTETPFNASVPLHFACQYECPKTSVEMARQLLSTGAQVNYGDHSMTTPLIIACQCGNLELVTLLLDHGADMEQQTMVEDYPDALAWAVDTFRISRLEVDEIREPFSGNTALLQAVRERHVLIVKELINHGCQLHARNAAGNTALHIACKSLSRCQLADNPSQRFPTGHVELVQLLIDCGCDINDTNNYLETPLKRAVDGVWQVGNASIDRDSKVIEMLMFMEIMQILIQSGADPCIADMEGSVPVQSALQAAYLVAQLQDDLGDVYEHTLKMLVYAGAKVSYEYLPKDATAKALPSLLQFLKLKASTSPTLKQLCRIAIRTHVSTVSALRNLSRLGLPKLLEKYVALDQLE